MPTYDLGKRVWFLAIVYREVFTTQSKNCLGVLHIGMTATAILPGLLKQGWRLELFTPYHKFRFSWRKVT